MATTPFPATATIRGVDGGKLVSLPRFLIYLGFAWVRLIGRIGRKSLERIP
jgi:hypothetical protein